MPNVSLRSNDSIKTFIQQEYELQDHALTACADAFTRALPGDKSFDQTVDQSVAYEMYRGVLRNGRFMLAPNGSVYQGFKDPNDAAGLIKIWDQADDALVRMEKAVGLYNRLSSSDYEKCFGKHKKLSDSLHKSRADFVGDVLAKIRAAAKKKPWFVTANKPADTALAAHTGPEGSQLMSIKPGMSGYFAMGILIHEWSHNVGMQDICEACVPEELNMKHEQVPANLKSGDLKCTDNNGHGSLKTGGHFLGEARTLLLPQKSKCLSTWNADNYRWFFYRCYAVEVAPELAVKRAEKAEKLAQQAKAAKGR
jgi:hypothetical protein